MYFKAMNMAAELEVEVHRNAANRVVSPESHYRINILSASHIAGEHVGRHMNTNGGISEIFRNYYQEHFTR